MAMLSAEVADRREVLPGRDLVTIHAPPLAAAARAGQFLYLLARDDTGLARLKPFAIVIANAVAGTVAIQTGSRTEPGPVGRLRPGDPVSVSGPVGRPFEVDARSRHLLLVAEGHRAAELRLLAHESVRAGRQVTLIAGAATARDVWPSSLLPDEVEYVVATADGSLGTRGDVVDLIPNYEAWADQAFAAASPATLARLAKLAASRRGRMGVATLGRKRGSGRADPAGTAAARRRSFLQVRIEPAVGCAAATCLGCTVVGIAGAPVRTCREGPVFAFDELDWDAAS
jgi:dihydroorotate dehydrogenase electron transfer subunit